MALFGDGLAPGAAAVGRGGVLPFSCNGRGATFSGAAGQGVTAAAGAPAPGAAGGFFAGGETGPAGGRGHVHGFIAPILTFGAGTGG